MNGAPESQTAASASPLVGPSITCLKGRAGHAVSLAAPTPRQTFPVRPELFKFTDPRAVCRLNRTSKTLQIDLQGTKAWARLAEAQLPPPRPRDDDEALARRLQREYDDEVFIIIVVAPAEAAPARGALSAPLPALLGLVLGDLRAARARAHFLAL